jgi:hypothetical protein
LAQIFSAPTLQRSNNFPGLHVLIPKVIAMNLNPLYLKLLQDSHDNMFGIINQEIALLQKYIDPASNMSEKEALSELIGILDNADILKKLKLAQHVIDIKP